MNEDPVVQLNRLFTDAIDGPALPDVGETDDGNVFLDWERAGCELSAEVDRRTGEFWWAVLYDDGEADRGHGNVFSTAGPFLVHAARIYARKETP